MEMPMTDVTNLAEQVGELIKEEAEANKSASQKWE